MHNANDLVTIVMTKSEAWALESLLFQLRHPGKTPYKDAPDVDARAPGCEIFASAAGAPLRDLSACIHAQWPGG